MYRTKHFCDLTVLNIPYGVSAPNFRSPTSIKRFHMRLCEVGFLCVALPYLVYGTIFTLYFETNGGAFVYSRSGHDITTLATLASLHSGEIVSLAGSRR